MTWTVRTRKISFIKVVLFFDTFVLWNGYKNFAGSLLLYISITFIFLSQVKSKLRLFELEWMIRRGKVVMFCSIQTTLLQFKDFPFAHDMSSRVSGGGGRVGWKGLLRKAWQKDQKKPQSS